MGRLTLLPMSTTCLALARQGKSVTSTPVIRSLYCGLASDLPNSEQAQSAVSSFVSSSVVDCPRLLDWGLCYDTCVIQNDEQGKQKYLALCRQPQILVINERAERYIHRAAQLTCIHTPSLVQGCTFD